MPTVPLAISHRQKVSTTFAPHALTVRPLNKKQVQADPAAAASINKEWKRLRDRKAWDETTVREWSDVAAEARRANEEVHMGMLVGFVVEKNPDLPVGDLRRKFKGRVVFSGQYCCESELGSCHVSRSWQRSRDDGSVSYRRLLWVFPWQRVPAVRC